MFRPTHAIINLEAIRNNFLTLKKMVGQGFMCPMIKANAYGHGDVMVAKALAEAGAEQFGVASIEEGLHLREAGERTPILVFGRLTLDAAKAALENALTPVISSWDDLAIFDQMPVAPNFHLKLNTGMNRMGFSLADVSKLRDFLKTHPKLHCLGVGTHLSHGDDAADAQGRSEKQMAKFRQAFDQFGNVKWLHHVLNSDALMARSHAKMDNEWLGARPGSAIYNLGNWTELNPVMSLYTKLDLVRRVPKGESISYGGRWTASKDSWIGIVPIGYGDGYWRSLGNKSQMLYRGERVPVVGTVCMDYSLLDLTLSSENGEPRAGEEVVVFGSQGKNSMSVLEIAKLVDSIPYELVTNLNSRVPRVYR